MMISSHKVNAIRKDSCDSSPKYISIGNPHLLIFELYFCLINLAAISFQYCSFCSLFY